MASDDEIRQAVYALRRAVENPGHVPGWHRKIMALHRRQWPTLWRAIDHLLTMESTTPRAER